MLRKFFSNKKGQGLVEYGLIIAGVALVSAAAISLFGHKTADLIAATAAVLPGAHADDNGPIVTGKLIETAADADGALTVDTAGILVANGTGRLGANLGVTEPDAAEPNFGGLVLEAE